MLSPFRWLGCAATGEHVWSKTYKRWDARKERICLWCDKTETKERGAGRG